MKNLQFLIINLFYQNYLLNFGTIYLYNQGLRQRRGIGEITINEDRITINPGAGWWWLVSS